MSRRIVIEFLGKDTSLSRTTADVQSKTSKLSSNMQKAGNVAGKLLAGGAVLAAGGLYKMGQAAAEDEAAQAKLAAALRQGAGATDDQIAKTEEWITAMGKQLGVADDDLRPALSKLADATGDVGKAQQLTALAMDISAGTGKDLNTVVEGLVKAQNGSIGGLSRLGVATKDADGKTKSLKDVTADLTDLYSGRAAQAAETTAGKQKILQTQLGELGEKIGAKVLPAMVKLSDIGLKMVDWVSRNTTTVGVLVGILGGLAAATWAVGAAISAWAAITKIATAIQVIWTNAQWALNIAMAANPIGLVVIAIAALVAGLIIAYKKSETFRKIVDKAFRWVKSAAVAVWNFFKSAWPKVKDYLTAPIRVAMDNITNSFHKIKDAGSAVVGWVRDIPGKLRDLGSRFADAGRALIGKFFDGFTKIGGFVGDIVSAIRDGFVDAINWVIDKLNDAIPDKLSIPGAPDIDLPNSPIPHVPHFAGGARNFRGGLALVGEGGPELVGLPRGSNVYSNRQSSAMLGGDRPIVIQVMLDGRVVEQSLIRRSRLTGQPIQIKTLG